jgi:hypothetical protein
VVGLALDHAAQDQDLALPPDFQRKLAEMNLQLNFLYRRLSVAMTNQKPLALWNINGQGDLSGEWLID